MKKEQIAAFNRLASIRARMKAQIHSQNTPCTEEYLSDKDDAFLLCLVHPLDREDFSRQINTENRIINPPVV